MYNYRAAGLAVAAACVAERFIYGFVDSRPRPICEFNVKVRIGTQGKRLPGVEWGVTQMRPYIGQKEEKTVFLFWTSYTTFSVLFLISTALSQD